MGGYDIDDSFPNCNPGTGPITTHDQDFFPAGREFTIPWLFSSPSFRRQNLVLLNPDAVPSTVEITITSADGKVTRTNTVTVGPKAFFQINELFRRPEWQDFMTAIGSQQFQRPAARAKIRATTRLYALGYVISWENNTVSVSLPMVRLDPAACSWRPSGRPPLAVKRSQATSPPPGSDDGPKAAYPSFVDRIAAQ